MVLDLIDAELFQQVMELVKNVIIFGVDMSFSVHRDNKKKDILILDEAHTQRLDDTTLTTEKKYWINFTESKHKFCLNLLYNGTNRSICK